MQDSLPTGALLANAQPGNPPRRQVYAGSGISLVPLDAHAHVPALFAASHGDAQREALWTYMHNGPFANEAAMLAWYGPLESKSDPLFFTVIDEPSGQPVGMVSFMNIHSPMRILELGHIWYGPGQQRSQTNTEAILLLLTEAFEVCQCRRVEWKCDSLNARSRAAALRLGFQYEGLFRQHFIIKQRNRDTAWFSMLDSEWPKVRSGMQRWLAWGAEGRPSLMHLISQPKLQASP